MNEDGAELDDLLGPLRDRPVALSSAAEIAARRERLLPALRAEVSRVPVRMRRRRLVRRAGAAAACCAAALLAWAGVELQRTRPPALHVEALGAEGATWIDADGTGRRLGASADIAGQGELLAPASTWSRISTPRGVRVELAPRSRLRVPAARAGAPALRLDHGEVHCRVPKLGEREQFAIATPDARIIVHGTEFSVRVGAPLHPQTCVRVTEGLVEVRHEGGAVKLGPGAQWGCAPAETRDASALARAPESGTAGPAPAEDALSAVVEAPQAAAERRSARPVRARAPRANELRAPQGTLDEENALLAAALAFEREGDRARAQALFSELLARYPRSPLAPEARAGAARTR